MPKIGVLGLNQLWSERPYRFEEREAAEAGVKCRKFRRVSRSLVQELAPPVTDGALGVGNALPFSKASNPIIAPHKLHYEIPHAGDIGYMRHYRPVIQVSGRIAPEIRALECVPLPKRGASSA